LATFGDISDIETLIGADLRQEITLLISSKKLTIGIAFTTFIHLTDWQFKCTLENSRLKLPTLLVALLTH
jgi:hypothetical protein